MDVSEEPFLVQVRRPNGKFYRPRKLRFSYWFDDGQMATPYTCLVLGTHDIEAALAFAELRTEEVDPSIILGQGERGWWRDAIMHYEPYWALDEVRGAAGVMFREEGLR